ncbi:MAG: helix-turn-helix transcriptional regulator [Thermodesulfovibrionales bacterium]
MRKEGRDRDEEVYKTSKDSHSGEVRPAGRPKEKKGEEVMERLLTVEEVAEMLGIKRHSVYHLVFHKRIPCLKISKGCLRFRKSDIEKWLKTKEQEVDIAGYARERYRRRHERKPSRPDPMIDRLIEEAKREAVEG